MRALLTHQAEISLMHKLSGLECVVLAFATHVSVREAMKFAIHEGKELLKSRLVTLAPVREESRDLALR
jgi:hypothetical protein